MPGPAAAVAAATGPGDVPNMVRVPLALLLAAGIGAACQTGRAGRSFDTLHPVSCAALRGLDTNRDGWVDSGDRGWLELRVWQDSDGDGVVDAIEVGLAGDRILRVATNCTRYTRPDGGEGVAYVDEATGGLMLRSLDGRGDALLLRP